MLYHRVAEVHEESDDPFLLSVSPRRFEEHLEILRRTANIMPLGELLTAAREGRLAPRSVALSFDDGYADSLYAAKPLLEAYDAPATVFVVAGCLGGTFWWDELLDAIVRPPSLPDRLQLTIRDQDYEWRLGGSNRWRRDRLFRQLYRLLRELDADERRAVLQRLASWCEGRPAAPNHRRPLTDEELVELAAGGLIEAGAHGMTHRPLSGLSETEQHHEIAHSKTALEEALGMPVTSFSYPYGLEEDFTAKSVALVERSGFDRACTNVCDVVDHATDPYRLPRFWVRNWDGDRFQRLVSRWLGR
ncbi:MAG: polysaccharide deacetylase family protein [Thermoanaerobaculia bacterium]